jgi:4-amino-4-deoxy-L-arabinose transferase-like glycosyltransferase
MSTSETHAAASREPEIAPNDEAPAEASERHEHASDRVRALGGSERWLPGLALLVTLASLLGLVSSSGIWDPFELRVAELSRRIALNLLGAKDLAIEGAPNGVPSIGDLARGQLPFTSIAVGFKLFGLHEWAGRLPLALWGVAGVAATYFLVRRLSDRIAGAFAALALATMPMYFVHARTMLGDIVTMSALAIALMGLGLAVFDRELGSRSRGVLALVGALGLGAGFGARGVLVGVAAPALAVGAAWLLLRVRESRREDGFGDVVGAIALAAGVGAAILGLRVILRGPDAGQFSALLGARVETQRQFPTYDVVLQYLGHGLYPWSAVVPFAVGRLLAPPAGLAGSAAKRETALRVLVILGATTSLGAHALLAPVVGILPFSGLAALAAIAALCFRDLDRGSPGSRTLAMGVVAFAILFYEDFKNFPDKGLSAFVVQDARFPDSFKDTAHKFLKIGTLAFIVPFFAATMERTDASLARFRREDYLAWPKLLKTIWAGNLWFAFLVSEAALAGYAALAYLSDKQFHWKQFQALSPLARDVASYGYLVLPVLVVVLPALALLGRDISRELFVRLPVSRGTVAMLSVVACGSVLSFGYFPKLASQISPKAVFDAYRDHKKPGEALGIMGVGSGTATYYAGRDVPSFDNATAAFQWLTKSPEERRWLVVRSAELAQINSLFRGQPSAPGNVPVLDAHSSEILLLSNRLESGEKNENPFADWILDQPPHPSRRLDANLGGQLDVLGWDVTDASGKPMATVSPGVEYDFRIYYKVAASISGNWETFIHIDGFQRRFNGDHQTLENKYAFHLWRVGDYVVDIYRFSLEPNFTPGDYDVFFGLFIGNRRLDVKRGRQNDNRVEAGKLRVQ